MPGGDESETGLDPGDAWNRAASVPDEDTNDDFDDAAFDDDDFDDDSEFDEFDDEADFDDDADDDAVWNDPTFDYGGFADEDRVAPGVREILRTSIGLVLLAAVGLALVVAALAVFLSLLS